MRYKKYRFHLSTWAIPALYAAAAIAAGLTFPRFESRIFPGLVHPTSVSVAIAIYSSIASGMIALTGIVFSLTFVMVQFSATAYSPRLVLWVARDPVISHALGIFTATFLYALAALGGVDRSGSETVPFISAWVVIGLLLASVGMFIALIHRITFAPGQPHVDFHGRPRTEGDSDNLSVSEIGGYSHWNGRFSRTTSHPDADSSRTASLGTSGRCRRVGESGQSVRRNHRDGRGGRRYGRGIDACVACLWCA